MSAVHVSGGAAGEQQEQQLLQRDGDHSSERKQQAATPLVPFYQAVPPTQLGCAFGPLFGVVFCLVWLGEPVRSGAVVRAPSQQSESAS